MGTAPLVRACIVAVAKAEEATLHYRKAEAEGTVYILGNGPALRVSACQAGEPRRTQ